MFFMEYSQVERRRFLIPAFKGSNPFTPTIIQFTLIKNKEICNESNKTIFFFKSKTF